MAVNKPKVLAAAQKHIARGNVDRAIKELGRIVKDDPKDLRVRQKIAELNARQGRIQEAIRDFQYVAESYEHGGFYPKAAAIYKQMIRFEPKEMMWHLALGEIYQQLALLSDAMDHFNLVARHYEANGNTRERADIYKKLLALNQESFEYAAKLSEIYVQDADYDGAFDVYRKIAATLEQRNDVEGLIRAYEKMSSLKPDDLTFVRALADLYLDRGDPKRALAKLQICFKADPQDTETLNLLADAFVDLGERAKAVAVLKELAQVYESLGYEDYRNQVYDRIAEVDPQAGEGYEGDSSLDLPGGAEAIAGLDLSEPEQQSDELQRALLEADVYVEYGLAEHAQRSLLKTAARFPNSFETRRQSVPLFLHLDDLAGALAQLDSMYELAMDRNDHEAALSCLARIVDLDPEDDAAHARLVAFEKAMTEMSAGSSASMSVNARPEDFGAAVDFGAHMERSGNDDDEFDFNDAEMQRLAAELSAEMGGGDPNQTSPALARSTFGQDLSTAATEIDVAGVSDEDPFAALDDLEGLLDLGDLGDLGEATRRNPYDLGQSSFQAGDYDAAASEFRRAVDEGVRVADSLEMLGLCLRSTEDFRGAVDAFKRVLKEAPTDTETVLRAMYEIGVTYESAGNEQSAYKIYQRVVDRRPDFRDGEARQRADSLAARLGI